LGLIVGNPLPSFLSLPRNPLGTLNPKNREKKILPVEHIRMCCGDGEQCVAVNLRLPRARSATARLRESFFVPMNWALTIHVVE